MDHNLLYQLGFSPCLASDVVHAKFGNLLFFSVDATIELFQKNPV